jgi:serine/threonine protein kinase/tetratricopeptide (TPR) repeat protein
VNLAAGTQLGPYEILSPLGAGGMGEVYRARDTRLGRDVALKVIHAEASRDPDRIKRFEQEARAASALSHPNVCAIFDIGSFEGSPFVVMELLEGETLRARLDRGPVPTRRALDYATQAARGLAAAHRKGIVHRDFKPENLFVTVDGQVKILDFGIAKLTRPPEAGELTTTAAPGTATATGATLGTMGYMSPEQLRGQPVDPRTDIFSFGCVLHEMLSGRAPFLRDTGADTAAAILQEDPLPLAAPEREVPAALRAIVGRCLEKCPGDRFSSAHDLRLALESVAGAMPARGSPRDSTGNSVVVLPFENLSSDAENAFFADGLTEELIADLSKVRPLRVISRTSAMLLRGSNKDVPTIARELGVRYVLEGSVRRAGSSLRITAQLIDAENDSHVWAEKYGGTLDDVFAIQDSVSGAIVDALKVRLTADERHRLTAPVIPDARAFDLYLRARQESYRLSKGALDHAIQLAREALAIVGPNALLYSLLGEIEFFYHDQGIHPDEETLSRAESWAAQALERDPECAAGLRVRGLIAGRKGDMRRALGDLRRASELQAGGDTLGFLVWMCAEVGGMAEARRHAEEAVALDPLHWYAWWGRAWVALLDGDFDTALERYRHAAGVGGGEPVQLLFVAIASAYAGRREEACEILGRVGDMGGSGLATVSAVLLALFRRDVVVAADLLGRQTLRDLARQDKEFSWWLAAACSHAGRPDEALHWLANAIDLGFVNHRFFSAIDPFLAALRGDSRFVALMERAREKQRAFTGDTPC